MLTEERVIVDLEKSEMCSLSTYMDQKNKAKKMVKEAITGYEVKMAMEIKHAKDSGRKMWKYINKLKLKGMDLKQKNVDSLSTMKMALL